MQFTTFTKKTVKSADGSSGNAELSVCMTDSGAFALVYRCCCFTGSCCCCSCWHYSLSQSTVAPCSPLRATARSLRSRCDRRCRVHVVVAMVVTSLPATSYRRRALSLTALVVVAQLLTSSSLALSTNRFSSRQRLQQLIRRDDGEL